MNTAFEWRRSARVPVDHPSLAGHFPGNPVVPAVVVLQQVLDAVQAGPGSGCTSQWRLRRVLAAKFLLPLRPDEGFEILVRMTGTRVDFRCERGAELVVLGSWEMTMDAARQSSEDGA